MPIEILPNGRFLIPEILEMPFKGENCHICGFVFTDMTLMADINAHEARCAESKAEENKKMIAAGYKQTSKGWVMR